MRFTDTEKQVAPIDQSAARSVTSNRMSQTLLMAIALRGPNLTTDTLDRQKRLSVEDRSPEQLLREAIDAIIVRGARAAISLPQIMNELALLPAARMTDPISQVPAEIATLRERAQLGRMLRGIGTIGREQGKVNLCGEKTRTYGLEPRYVAAALERLRSSGRHLEPVFSSDEPLRLGVAFCDQIICTDCPYDNVCSSATGLKNGKRRRIGGHPERLALARSARV